MKSLLIIFATSLCLFVKAQSFTAETGTIFTGATNKEYFGSIKILSGTLKKTDKLDIYAATGRKFQATITKMKVEDAEAVVAKPGQYVFIDFVTTEDASSGNDYLREGYKIFPRGTNPGNVKANNTNARPDKFTATIDGKPYRAASFNNAYYKKGVKGFAYDLPFIQLSLTNNDTTDTRSFVVQIFSPKEAIASYDAKSSEVNFSGAADGKKENSKVYGYVKGAKDVFNIEITKWQTVSANKAVISGKLSGNLKNTFSNKEVLKVVNGVFTDIEITVYAEQYDMSKLLKSTKN